MYTTQIERAFSSARECHRSAAVAELDGVSTEDRARVQHDGCQYTKRNASEISPSIMNDQPTVYIFEDDDPTRAALSTLLSEHNHAVVCCRSAEDFLSAYDARQAGCLVLDEQLPGMSGTALLARLRAEGRELPAVLLTAHAETSLTVRAMQHGATTVLDKPCSAVTIGDEVRKALRKNRRRQRHRLLAADAQQKLARLSDNERAVLMLVLDGVPNREIAAKLDVSVRTVETRRSRIYKALEVDTVAHVVRLCINAGLIES